MVVCGPTLTDRNSSLQHAHDAGHSCAKKTFEKASTEHLLCVLYEDLITGI